MKNMTRRGFLGTFAAAGSMALAACGGTGTTGAAAEASASASASVAEASAASLTTVQAGKLTCIANMFFPPFESMDEASGEPLGFDIDLAVALAEHMGLECNWLPSQQFDTLVPTIKAGGTADIAISGMTITDARKEEIDFSDAYIDSNQALVLSANSSETAETLNAEGKKVAVQAGTTGEEWVRENLPNATCVPLDEVISCMTSVSTGNNDALVIDLPVAANLITTSFSDLTVAEEIATGEQYGIAVSKDNPALLEAVNAALAEMEADGSMDEIEAKWFGSAL